MLKDSIQQLELSLLNSEVRKSKKALDSLIAEEFLEIGASGNVYNKDDILNALPNEETNTYSMSNFDVISLSEGLILATYTLSEKYRQTKRSSIWKSSNRKWELIFHQGTVIQDSTPRRGESHCEF